MRTRLAQALPRSASCRKPGRAMLLFAHSLRTMTARRNIASVCNLSNDKGILAARRSTTRPSELSGLHKDETTTTYWISQCEFSKRKFNSFQSVLLCIPPYYPTKLAPGDLQQWVWNVLLSIAVSLGSTRFSSALTSSSTVVILTRLTTR